MILITTKNPVTTQQLTHVLLLIDW